MYKVKDLTGQVFSRLTVIKFAGIKSAQANWECRCLCGNIIFVLGGNLAKSNTKSCGCLRDETTAKLNYTHGFSSFQNKTQKRFYHIWGGMIDRCTNLGSKNYIRYGAIGIIICDRWLIFENFKEDMWKSYLKHVEQYGEKETTLDRILNDGNYELSNCRWATYKEQANNTRISPKTMDLVVHNKYRKLFAIFLNTAIKKYKNTKLFEMRFGINLDGFKQHIESLFLPGMTWSNNGKGSNKWNLDHIIGCNNFDLSREEDRKKCWNYKNFQPLWYNDHLKKSKQRILEINL